MAMEKKTSNSKTKSSSPTLVHPPYLQMISEAINTMKDRTGSSQPAIAKFIEENYTNMLPPNFKKTLSIQLKRLVKSEKLVKIKNSYKISKTTLKEKKKQGTVVAAAKMSVEKAKKTKRLSQVKTPEALKKVKSGTVKKASAKKIVSPVKRKAATKVKAIHAKKVKK